MYAPVKGKCRYVCERCGRESDTEHHDWEDMPGKCTYRCRTCGVTKPYIEGEHAWKPIEGKCMQKCSDCGKERSIPHTWKRVPDQCEQVCEICGARQAKHDYDQYGKCRRCGSQDPEKYMDYCVEQLLSIFPTSPLDPEGHRAFDAAHRTEVRRIGEKLNELGGMRAMRRVGEEFARRRPIHARKLETTWDGIGNWMG